MVASAVTTTNSYSVLAMSTQATAILKTLTLCNSLTSGTAAVDVLVRPSTATTEVYLYRYTALAASQTVQPLAGALVVNAGGSLHVQASTANVVHVSASYLESE